MSTQISRSNALTTIPQKKLIRALTQTLKKCEVCSQNEEIKLSEACQTCRVINEAKQRYAKSNIPIRYWDLEMKGFKGDEILVEKYDDIVGDLNKSYDDGICLCFAGSHGIGKTYTVTNILKRAVEKGFDCLYVTLSDIVEMTTSVMSFDKIIARKELLVVDFLVIDEFDPRHMANTMDATSLYGRTLENIFRTRSQNLLPIFMCTNSPNVIESFGGSIKKSIESLMSCVEVIPVIGEDYRKVHGVS